MKKMKRLGEYDIDELDNNVRRARRARRLSVKSLAKRIKAPTCAMLYELERGQIGPLDNTGCVRPWVNALCVELGQDLAELFPRDICSIEREESVELLPEQLFGISSALSPGVDFETRRLVELLLAVVNGQHREILYRRFFKDETLEEVGKSFYINSNAVREKEAEALRRIRAWATRAHLKDLFFGNGIVLRDVIQAKERILREEKELTALEEEKAHLRNRTRKEMKLAKKYNEMSLDDLEALYDRNIEKSKQLICELKEYVDSETRRAPIRRQEAENFSRSMIRNVLVKNDDIYSCTMKTGAEPHGN